MSRIFTRKERKEAALRYAGIIRDVFGQEPGLIEEHLFEKGDIFYETVIVQTKYGPARTSFDISPTFAHLYFQFSNKPGDLPSGPSLNPWSFKWNDWMVPDTAPCPVNAGDPPGLEGFMVRQARRLACIAPEKEVPAPARAEQIAASGD